MKLTQKIVKTATVKNLTSDMLVSAFVNLDTAYGATTTLCTLLLDMLDTTGMDGYGKTILKDTASGFGVGGEGTPAYRRHSSFKTILGRLAKSTGRKRTPKWKRDADGNITDLLFVDIVATPDAEKPETTSGEKGTPQHVEETLPKVNTVKSMVDFIMENKPKRTKVSSFIIGLMAHLGKAGLVEVVTACQKMIDALPAETVETETEKAA